MTYAAKSPSASELSVAPETIYARTTMPEKAGGRITGTAAPNDPDAKNLGLVVKKVRDDNYAITKGQLSYIGSDKTLIPVAMTADGTAFPDLRPMYHGDAELKVQIAGKDYFSAYIHPDSYVLELSYELLDQGAWAALTSAGGSRKGGRLLLGHPS